MKLIIVYFVIALSLIWMSMNVCEAAVLHTGLPQEITIGSLSEVIKVLNSATPNDIVEIDANSFGGIVEEGTKLVHALKYTKAAKTIALVGDDCNSECTIIIAHTSEVKISPFSGFVIHLGYYIDDNGYKVVFSTNMPNAVDRAYAIRDYVELYDLYGPLLTPHEMYTISTGNNFYMSGFEFYKRAQEHPNYKPKVTLN